MEWAAPVIDFFMHLDRHIDAIIREYGLWTYLIVFVIIFCETGLVVTPFLPGDSLLFALGSFAAINALDLQLVLLIICGAAILGDTVNYSIGHFLAPKVFSGQGLRFIKREYLTRTEKFFAKYGGKTIIIARFVPIIRTFAPFLAGVGTMSYRRFLFYNVAGGILWTVTLVGGGYFFGNLPWVKENFSIVILAIILISLLPGIIEYWNHKASSRKTISPSS